MGRFFRWVSQRHAQNALTAGFFSHNSSALWVFDMRQRYRPAPGIFRGKWLIAYNLDDIATRSITTKWLLDFADPSFMGEKAHERQIIIKTNEPGSYGVGRYRQHLTNMHLLSTEFATKDEVREAIRNYEYGSDLDKYRPGNTWPK